MCDLHILLQHQFLFFSKHDCSNARTGYVSVLSLSSLLFRKITFFLLLKSHMLIVSPSTPRKRVGEESSVRMQDTISLKSIVAPNKLRTQGVGIESANYQPKSALVLTQPPTKPHPTFRFLATTSISKWTSSRTAHKGSFSSHI